MPIKHAIWKVGSQPIPLVPTRLENEQLLEDMIVASPEMLSGQWVPFDFIAHLWLVRPEVEKIFRYRSEALNQRFGNRRRQTP